MMLEVRNAIATILDGAVDVDDVVQRSVRLLAQLTHQVALVQYPTLSRSTVRHVELDDLLGRDPVILDASGLKDWIEGRTIIHCFCRPRV